ncbi:MAG: hypothetical protein AAB610_00475 [Patescibacteria group bacterium]
MKTSRKPLEVFYAITMTSLYLAEIGNQKKAPKLTKLECKKPAKNKTAIGRVVENGSMLAVGDQLVLFVPEGAGGQNTRVERELTMVNTSYWGGRTSRVVALFLDKNEARLAYGKSNHASCDKRWLPQTIATLKAIGLDHPKCSVLTLGEPGSMYGPLLIPDVWQK